MKDEVWKRTGVVYARFGRGCVTLKSGDGILTMGSKNDKKILDTLAAAEGKYAFVMSDIPLQEAEIQRIRALFNKANMSIRQFDMKVSDGDSSSEEPKWVNLEKKLHDVDDSTIFIVYGYETDAPTSRLPDGTLVRDGKFARFIDGEMIDGDDEKFIERLVATNAKSVVFMSHWKWPNKEEMRALFDKAGMTIKEFWMPRSSTMPGMVDLQMESPRN